jgi:hypothetical protein
MPDDNILKLGHMMMKHYFGKLVCGGGCGGGGGCKSGGNADDEGDNDNILCLWY